MEGLPARAIADAKANYFVARAESIGRPTRRWGRVAAIRWEELTVVYGLDAEHLDVVDEVIDWAGDVEPHFDVWPEWAGPTVYAALADRSFRVVATQSFLGKTADGGHIPGGVRWIKADELGAWTELYPRAYAFSFEDEEDAAKYRQDLARQYTGPDWHLCVAEQDGLQIAIGALRRCGDIGYLANAATLPDARGRGAQTALIALRAQRAAELDCRWLASDTRCATGSERNLRRAGFELAAHVQRWRRRPFDS